MFCQYVACGVVTYTAYCTLLGRQKYFDSGCIQNSVGITIWRATASVFAFRGKIRAASSCVRYSVVAVAPLTAFCIIFKQQLWLWRGSQQLA